MSRQLKRTKSKTSSKSPLLSLESFFKKYQSLLSLLIPTAISIVAIIISINSNNLTKQQIEREKVPLIDHQLIYDESGIELQEVKFSSLKQNIKILNLEVFTPSDVNYSSVSKVSKNERWFPNSFKEAFLSKFNEYYISPDKLSNELHFFTIEEEYPIAIKFNYVVDKEVKSIVALYKLGIQIYSDSKAKVEYLTFQNLLDDNVQITNYLDYLNNTEYFGKGHFAFDAKTDSIICQNETVSSPYFSANVS